MEGLIRAGSAIVGIVMVITIFYWAMRILMVPSATTPRGARIIFRSVRNVVHLAGTIERVQERRRQLWALYVPVSLLAIIAWTLAVTTVGYTLTYYGVSNDSIHQSYVNSVSSLAVLGFAGEPSTLLQTTLVLVEAFTGPIMVALLITYLASTNRSFNQHEVELSEMDKEVGNVTTGPALLAGAATGDGVESLSDIWKSWGVEFKRMQANYDTVQGYLLLFAPSMHTHWVTNALVVLDAANLRNHVLNMPVDADADLCLTSGAGAMSQSADQFHHRVVAFRHRTGPVDVTHDQFTQACAILTKAGVELKSDLEAAWTSFSTCRESYAQPVYKLAQMMDATIESW